MTWPATQYILNMCQQWLPVSCLVWWQMPSTVQMLKSDINFITVFFYNESIPAAGEHGQVQFFKHLVCKDLTMLLETAWASCSESQVADAIHVPPNPELLNSSDGTAAEDNQILRWIGILMDRCRYMDICHRWNGGKEWQQLLFCSFHS